MDEAVYIVEIEISDRRQSSMDKISEDFFKDKEILFAGYSSRNKAFCNSIMNAFVKHGSFPGVKR